jgi:hypothetical protein
MYNGYMRNVIQRKTCSKCGKRKRLSEFYTRLDDLQAWCKYCLNAQAGALHDQWRALVFEHYGLSCACCGATESLALDHVHGNGTEHRQRISKSQPLSGHGFYAWLVNQNFPPECEPEGVYALQTLCVRCNSSKRSGDHCWLHCAEHAHPRRDRGAPTGRTLADIAAEKAVRDAKILELRAQGWTQAKIAAEVGCHQATVTRALQAA